MGRGLTRLIDVAPRNLRALIVAFVAATNLFVLALAGYGLYQSRQQHESRAEALTRNQAEAVDYSLSNSIEKIDLALQSAADELEHQFSEKGVDPQLIERMLAKYEERLPEVEAIRISDARGVVIFGKGLDPKEGVSWADRESFILLRDHPEAGLHFAPPRMGKIAKRLIVSFARRYNHPDGSFAGIIAAPVALDYFTTLLSRFHVEEETDLVIRGKDFGLIARYPRAREGAATEGDRRVAMEMEELARSGISGASYHVLKAGDREQQVVTFRRIKQAPLTVFVAMARESYLAGWYADLWMTAVGVLGFVVFSFLLGWLAFHLLGRMQEIQRRLALAATVFSHAHEGLIICDARRIILDVNPTFSEITGYSREEMIGKTPGILGSGRQDGEFYRAMWQTIREQGHWEGEIWNRRKDGSLYAERLTISSVLDDRNQVTHYIGTFSDISVLKRHQAELERLAHYDALTHLPNRALLSDRMAQALAQARRNNSLVAVCYLDLDGFKAINDELGHDAGDALLIEVAQRLKEMLRAGDTVARLGGDEFVLLLVGVDSAEECERAATRVLRAIAAPIHIKGQERSISGSLGITLFPEDSSDPDTLLRHADQAMYAAKQAGKNRCQFHDSSPDQRARKRREAADCLQQALDNGEFRLYYQPMVDMRQGRVLGFEGLIRWLHPEHGLLAPSEFLPAAEGTEFDVAIGRWVLAEGVRQLAAWRRAGLPQGLSLNISAGHLLFAGFADELAGILAAHPELGPHALEIEILETAAIEDLEVAIAVFDRCHELGVDIALDDFGTGHASLSFFRRLPVDTLKIDQVFVQSILGDPEDLAVVESVVGLTRAFRRKLVAEGVESVEIGMLLLSLGCNVGQGYGIARPMPAEEVPGWVAGFVPDRNWSFPVTEFAPDDLPLFMAELEHRSWVRRMGEWLDENPGTPSPPTLDGHRCRLGQWYEGPGKSRYGRFPPFVAAGAIHEAAHRLGRELVQLCAEGRREEARRRFAELAALRDQLVEELANLQAEVIIERI
ncbi:MAG: diguanylate cyclase/phosphodiesterase with sensor(s) [Rhodocyclaceae bacterium]|nr:diguanylate cyclase/phosphodiesterase with sensor(s) [Rhodocyclaceae bacterium]